MKPKSVPEKVYWQTSSQNDKKKREKSQRLMSERKQPRIPSVETDTLVKTSGANSGPSGVPHLGCNEKDTSSRAEQLSGDTEPRGAGWYERKSPPLVPDWSVLMQMRTSNPHNSMGPKGIPMSRMQPLGWSEPCGLIG